MKSSPEPPHLAVWLLQRFGASESLTGDLIERFLRNRSVLWFWRQVVIAALARAAYDVKSRPLLTARGLVVGWSFWWLTVRYLLDPLSRLDDWLFVRGLGDLRSIWPNQHVVTTVLLCLIGAGCGWLVARWHRVSTVLLFVLSLQGFALAWLWLFVIPTVRLAPAFARHWDLVLFDAVVVIGIVPTVCLVCGLMRSQTHAESLRSNGRRAP